MIHGQGHGWGEEFFLFGLNENADVSKDPVKKEVTYTRGKIDKWNKVVLEKQEDVGFSAQLEMMFSPRKGADVVILDIL